MDEEPFITTKDAAKALGFSVGTLKVWRSKRKGPPFYRIGTSVRYRESELHHWFQRHGEHHVNK